MLAKSALLCLVAVATAANALPSGRLTFNFNGAAEAVAEPADTWVNPYNETTFAKMLALEPPLSVLNTNAACPPTLPKFSCKAPTTKFAEATRVDRLRPGDISAIMAIGDSITAGFVMTSGSLISARVLEDRGKVYSTGGDAGATTLNNFLKVYNPKIVGSSTGTTVVNSSGKELNSAVTGARVNDLPSQIERLVTQLKSSTYSSVANKWKMLTVFIGANNICDICSGTTEASANAFESKLRESLNLVRSKIPKTYVALITTFGIAQVYDAAQTTSYCKSTFKSLGLCSCAGTSDATRKQMDEGAREYNRRAEKIAQEFQKLEDPDFTVSVLPGISDLKFAQWGQCYLSNFDCFHPNQEADSAFALSFWNNLFEPRGKKTTSFDPYNAELYCPDENDYFI